MMCTIHRCSAGAVLVALALLGATGCGPGPAPAVAPSTASAGGPAPAFRPAVSVPPDTVFVIPTGTFAAEARGEPAFAIPSEIHVALGQSIVVRNEDQAMHYFFNVPIAPGESFRKPCDRSAKRGYNPGLSC